ncbi:uncharacterized protein LOC107721799 [Sinocyclocheilus rhinocerous]|uniref:uncharacterized protein LOC107721799 n=1 Tax=Sinocyclocheilus rhinocerous TaxID=307959 RepID=UPI0007B9D593|nr:PREDICTED: uncharacterized protein LOC107721799 [Sinocyclocheilus rhinocerous]
MDLLIFLLVTVIPVISDGLTVHGPPGPLVAPLGSSVVLPCYVDELLSVEGLEVEWRRPDSETLVHLYQDGESQTEAQQQDYQDRAHFFTEEIQHGNFSLRLDNLRAEDEGRYTCTVYSQQESGETVVQINIDVERLLVSGSSRSISASVGEDVTLNCSVDSHITLADIEEVSWKKTDEDEEIMVLLFQDQVDLPEASDEQYRDRVEFFTAEIPKLNFSLRLKSVRTEDKGVYMCEVFAGGLSANATVVLERLGFSVLHIMVLILCVSASGSALLLCCLIYCRSPYKGFFGQQTYNDYFELGSSVVLTCHVDECLLKKKLKVEWRRKDTKTLVHLYQDGESQTKKQHKDYQDRANFFTDDIQHGNFSLRLDNLRAEDAGEYICKVYSDLFTVTRTAETSLEPQFEVKGSTDDQTVPLGGSVVLPCQVDENLLQKNLKVEWRRADSETLVHLYQDGESRPKKQHKNYHDRAHFITDEIEDGNFSLRLEKVRAEDAGKYACKVYSDQDCVHSADAEVEILGFGVKCHILATLGSSVVLSSHGQKPLPVEGLHVEWRRTDLDSDSDSDFSDSDFSDSDSEILVHLYQDGKSRAEKQQQDYQDRAHFFTEEIQHGNFSLRLDNLRAEDEGRYTCNVYSQQRSVFSAETNLILRLLDLVFRLQVALVFCPNVLMFLAFVLWGVSEGSLSETVSCCALYFLRPLLLLWAAPYISNFTGKIKSLILKYSYVAEYLVLSLVVYSALFTSAWQKLLNYDAFDRAVVIVLFAIVFVCCLCKIIYLLVTEVGKKSGRIVKIFDIVADMTFQILPTLQFILLFYTFGAGGEAGLIMIVILPVLLMMMTNDRWLYKCYSSDGLNLSYSVVRTVMLIFTLVTNAVMIGLYILTLDNQTDPIGWGCVMVFLQILWTVMFFTDAAYSFLSLSRDFQRYVAVYVFGSVGVVLLNSAALITELILKTVNGDRVMADLRFIVFPSECLFAASLLISGFSGSKIASCLKSCQNKVRSIRVKRSQQNQSPGDTQEMRPLNTGDQEQNQPDSVRSQT